MRYYPYINETEKVEMVSTTKNGTVIKSEFLKADKIVEDLPALDFTKKFYIHDDDVEDFYNPSDIEDFQDLWQ